MDLCEFEASLVYRVSSRTARATQRKTLSQKHKNKQKEYFHCSLQFIKTQKRKNGGEAYTELGSQSRAVTPCGDAWPEEVSLAMHCLRTGFFFHSIHDPPPLLHEWESAGNGVFPLWATTRGRHKSFSEVSQLFQHQCSPNFPSVCQSCPQDLS